MSFDVVTFGEAMLRLWTYPGKRLENAEQFQVSVGGAEANVAVALARAGQRVSWVSRLPESSLGRRIAVEIQQHGVDLSGTSWSSDGRAGLYFVELSGTPRPISVLYDRNGSSASQMSLFNTDLEIVTRGRVCHLSGITPALSSNCRDLCREAFRLARSSGILTTLDINYRSALWSVEEARRTILELSGMASLVVCTSRDAQDLFGVIGNDEDLAKKLSEIVCSQNVVVTHGENGVTWQLGQSNGAAEVIRAETLDRVGAGDAFMAGIILGLLDGDCVQGIRRGQAMAAVKRGIFGDQLLATNDEIDMVLGGIITDIRR